MASSSALAVVKTLRSDMGAAMLSAKKLLSNTQKRHRPFPRCPVLGSVVDGPRKRITRSHKRGLKPKERKRFRTCCCFGAVGRISTTKNRAC